MNHAALEPGLHIERFVALDNINGEAVAGKQTEPQKLPDTTAPSGVACHGEPCSIQAKQQTLNWPKHSNTISCCWGALVSSSRTHGIPAG